MPYWGLSSSLGNSGGGGLYGSSASYLAEQQQRAAAQPQHEGGGWLGSLTDPLGLVSGVKGLVTGLAHTGNKFVMDTSHAIGHAAAGEWGMAQSDLSKDVQNAGDFGMGMLTMGENLVTTAALPFGGEHGLTGTLKDQFQGFNKWVAGGGGPSKLMLSNEFKGALDNGGKGMAPTDWWTEAEHGGIGKATLDTAMQVALVAAPIAGVSGAMSGSAAEAAAASEEAGATADAAAFAAKAAKWDHVNTIAKQFEHPLSSVMKGTADLLGEMRARAYPAELPPEEAAVTAAQATPESVIPHEQLMAVRANMDPAASAADAMASADTAAYALNPELTNLMAEFQAKAEPPNPAGPTEAAAPGTVRLYNGGQNAESMWTSDINRAESYRNVGVGENTGKVRYVDVPADQAAQLKTTESSQAYEKATTGEGNNNQPNTATDYYLGDRPDLVSQAGEHVAPSEATPAEVRTAKPIEPQLEPRTYNVGKGKVLDASEKEAADAALRSDTAAARESVNPPLYVYDELGKRLSTPSPQWAQNIAEALPDSWNRLLGRMGANLVTINRFRNLHRSLQQAMETAQQRARTSPAMRAGIESAQELLSKTVDRGTASARVGEEIHARLNGEALLSEWAKNHGGVQAAGDARIRLEEAGRGGYKGVTDAMLTKMGPEDAAKYQEAMNAAVEGFKAEAKRTMETLLATRFGAKGLESALLSPDEVPMSTEQIRLYKRSIRDLRYAEKAKERIPGEIEKRMGDAALAEARGTRMHGFVDRLRARLGTTLQTVDDLYRGIPKGMEDEGAATIALGLRTLAEEGGALLDVGTREALHPTEGIYVPLSQQFDIPLADWAAEGPQALHDAIFEPKATGGQVYDAQRLYGGPDAKLALNIVDAVDGTKHVVGTISQHTIDGDPILPWQAHILGSAHEQAGGIDFATGKDVLFPTDPNEANLSMHYAGDVLNPKSGLSRWANERSAVVADEALNITSDQLNAEMTANLWLDHIMEGRNNGWNHGDVFNTELSMGKAEPTLEYLAQTIMEDNTVPGHVDKAMLSADVHSVNNFLAWYYKSHDFIEGAYRGQTVPITGRDAAETFYDVLALSSVMASPTQNLGRALAGFANLEDFLQARKEALTNATEVMDSVMGNKPNDVVYVKNLGVNEADIVREDGETVAAYKRRLAKGVERVVQRGEGGTPVSRRWLESPAARDLSAQTSMTTGPKYRIIDALLGKLNLESATAEDIGGQPEWWTGNHNEFSDANLSPQAIIHHAGLSGITGPEFEAYKQWAVDHERIAAAKDVRIDSGKNYVKPITDAEDVQRIRAEREAAAEGGFILGGREVGAQEYQNLAQDGRAIVEQKLANSMPHVLDTPEARRAAYDAASAGEWSGATVDAHTGQAIPSTYAGDTFAVTARLKGMKELFVPTDANFATFDRKYTQALKMYKDVLDSDGGHLGVFWNVDTNRIEFDPVYHTMNVPDTEAVGTYAHANGGAYNFRTEKAYWTPHVKDDEAWASNEKAKAAVKSSAAQGRFLARNPVMRPAYENALMEYHGSTLLAKLRSFRDNLAHPHTSLAVTLDSIMAQLFGFDKTHWATKGEYAKYADRIRESAAQWSQVAGRQVMPHEVQALLWVYAKRFIGEQDWGRLQAHVTNANTALDYIQQAVIDGKQVNVRNFDPLGNWWKEELQFSRDQLSVRTERKPLRVKRTAGTLTPTEAARLDYLESVPTRRETQAQIMGPDGVIDYQSRNETGYDAKMLSHKEDQYVQYLTETLKPMRKAIDAGDFERARAILNDYMVARKKAIMGSIEGGEFGPKMLADPKGVGAQSIARLQYAEHVPAPNPEALSANELADSFAGKVRGVTLTNPNKMGRLMQRLYDTADVSTLLHEDLHAFRLLAPGDEVAELSNTYPHLQDATMTAARRADEEAFVADFMGYLRARASAGDGRLSPAMRARLGAKYTGPLAALFNNVSDLMEQHYGPAFNTEAGRAVPNQIVDYWDSIFNQDIQRPDVAADPLQGQYAPQANGINPRQLRGESNFAFTQRVRQYGEARGRADVLAARVRDMEANARRADKFANDMRGLVIEPTRSAIRAAQLEDRAARTLGKISEQVAGATGNAVPRGWRPFMQALERMTEEAKANPELLPILEEIPDNFEAALRFAAERGFEPTYMPELTWDMAQKYLYKHLQLSTKAEASGLRRENLGVLNRAKVVDRSLESLGAGSVMAMKELLQSKIVQFTEENYAKEWAPGTAIPDGWKPWDSTRDAIITGRNLDGKEVAVNANKIIPKEVYDTLRGFQNPHAVDMPFRFLFKGPAINVWKHILLTFSPTWYLKHFIGAITLATLEGVTPADWMTAWRQFKTNQLPDVVSGRTIYNAIDTETGKAGSLIPRNKIKDFPDLVRSEGYGIAAHEVTTRMRNVVKTVDGLGRAAVYAKTLRTGGSIEFAAARAFEALGDFGRLSPIERSLVTQLIPFYAFQKAMFRLLLRFPVDHPLAAPILIQLGYMHQAYLRERLGGSLPEAYLGADYFGGHLTPIDKLNPLLDSYRLATPEGLAASANPFVRLFAQQALHAPTYGGNAGMDERGNLIQTPDLGQTILDTYQGGIPGLGTKSLGRDMLNITSGLSDAQYQKLLKRILKTQNAEKVVENGGFLVQDAYKPVQPKTPTYGGAWGH